MRTPRPGLLAVGLAGVALLVSASARSQDSSELRGEAVAGWHIYVKRPGVVRVPIADLPGRAICPAPGAQVNLSLTTRGQVVPYWVNEKRNLLCFWGEPDFDSHDARGRCYRLREPSPSRDKAPISCFNDVDPIPALVEEDDLVAKGTRTLYPDEERTYHPIECLDAKSLAKGARPGGYWFYEKTFTVTSDFAGAAQLALKGVHVLRLQKMPLPGGRTFQELGIRSTDAPGTLTLRVNGAKVGEKDVTKQGADLAFEVTLVEGKNTIELSAERGGTVLAQRSAVTFEAPVTLGSVFVASGPTRFASANGLVAEDLDEGKLLEIKVGEKTSGIKSKKGHRTLVFDSLQATRPAKIVPYPRGTVQSGARWVAVAPRALLEAVKPLEAHRKAQGLTTALYAFEDVCDEYTDGTFDPLAVQALGDRTAHHFLLLVGDAAWDGRPDDGPWLPTFQVDTYDNGGSGTDSLFARRPGQAVGRFPCRTKEEVAAMVAKTIAYEKQPATAVQKDLAFVCGEGRFGPMVDGMIENLFTQAVGKRVPACFDVDVSYANPTSVYFFPPDDFAKRVVERLSQGPLIFDYIGHGAPESLDNVYWERKRFPILTVKDAEKVACPEGRYPIALITACWTGCFDEPEKTVGEALALNPKGAVAVLAASRISHPFANALLSLDLTENLFREGDERLGTRIKKTLDGLSLKSGGTEGKMVVKFGATMLEEDDLAERLIEDERHLYNLLGDPALVVRLPRRISVVSPAEAPAGTSVTVKAEDGASHEGKELALLALERVRAPRTDLSGLEATVGPDSMKDGATEKKVRETYRLANDLVLVKGTVDGAQGVLALPADLAPGTYVVKVATKDGAVGSASLVVQKPGPKPRKYY